MIVNDNIRNNDSNDKDINRCMNNFIWTCAWWQVSRDISNVLAPSPPKAKTSAASAGPSGQSVLGPAHRLF